MRYYCIANLKKCIDIKYFVAFAVTATELFHNIISFLYTVNISQSQYSNLIKTWFYEEFWKLTLFHSFFANFKYFNDNYEYEHFS